MAFTAGVIVAMLMQSPAAAPQSAPSTDGYLPATPATPATQPSAILQPAPQGAAPAPPAQPYTPPPYSPQPYGPQPYTPTSPPMPRLEAPGWRGAAAAYLAGGGEGAGAGCARLNNYWCVAQTWGDPWVGSNGADGRYALFVDPRWSGRAAAFDLRDRHKLGKATARDIAAAYAPPCEPPPVAAAAPAPDPASPYSPAPAPAFTCPGLSPEAIAAGTGRGPDQDLGLFDSRGDPTPSLRIVLRNLSAATLGNGRVASDALLDLAVESVGWASIAQDGAGFSAWRAATPSRDAAVRRFEAFLQGQGVLGVLPTYQIMRTGSDWRGCGGPFVTAPDSVWPNLVETLRLVRDRIKPEFPALEAMSGYRDAWQNQCMGGAENSAHRQFLALDLVPNTPIERYPLQKKLCVAYNAEGDTRQMGLGFYRGVRFHVDTWKHRTWANENGQSLNVCNEEAPIAGPPAPIPYGELVAK